MLRGYPKPGTCRQCGIACTYTAPKSRYCKGCVAARVVEKRPARDEKYRNKRKKSRGVSEEELEQRIIEYFAARGWD